MRDVKVPLKHKPLTYIKPAILLVFLATLYTHHYTDPSFNRAVAGESQNFLGSFGSYCSDLLFQFFGIIAYFIPVMIAGYIIKSALAKRCKVLPYTLQSLGILALLSTIAGFHTNFDIFYSGLIGNLSGLIVGFLPDLIALPLLYGGLFGAIATTFNLPVTTLGYLAYQELKKMAQTVEYELHDDLDITPTADQFVQKSDSAPFSSGLDINHKQSTTEDDWFTTSETKTEEVEAKTETVEKTAVEKSVSENIEEKATEKTTEKVEESVVEESVQNESVQDHHEHPLFASIKSDLPEEEIKEIEDAYEDHPIFQFTPSEKVEEPVFTMHAEPEARPEAEAEVPVAEVVETEITADSDLIMDHEVNVAEEGMIDQIFTEEAEEMAPPKIKFSQFEQTMSEIEAEEADTVDLTESIETVVAEARAEIKAEADKAEEIAEEKPKPQNIILLPRSIATETENSIPPVAEAMAESNFDELLDEEELLESIYEPEVAEEIVEEEIELPSVADIAVDQFDLEELTNEFNEPVTLSSPTATIERLIAMQKDQMGEHTEKLDEKLDTVLSILEGVSETIQDSQREEPTRFDDLQETAFIQESTRNNRPVDPTPITRLPKGESIKPVIEEPVAEAVEEPVEEITVANITAEEEAVVASSFKDQFKNRLSTGLKDEMKQSMAAQFKARLKEEMATRFQKKEVVAEVAEAHIETEAAETVDTPIGAAFEAPEATSTIEIKAAVYDEQQIEANMSAAAEPVQRRSIYKLPSIDFLNYSPPKNQEIDSEYLIENAQDIVECLEDFRIKGCEVKEIFQGPTLTTYELETQKGTRINNVTKYADEIASALRVRNVRMVPIHHKGVIGIEVPNKDRETVWLKEIIQSENYQKQVKKSKLTVALGKDISGEPIITDLAKMPHLLVAGTTGSGKSVFTNVLINSLLYNATPDEVKFILIDPKMLEFSMYNDIPNLLFPVIIDPKKAAHALNWAVDEMERRYKMIADFGEKDIVSYNEKAKEMLEKGLPREIQYQLQELEALKREIEVDETISEEERTLELLEITAKIDQINEKFEAPEILPYIVIVLDEYADLMMMAAKEVEISIARIAQKARAAGMHLVIATQRPDKDVVTGIIKANLPVRVALSVKGANNSRIILDDKGAERLLGRGDMLYLGPGTSEIKRIQSPWISTEEQKQILAFLRKQGRPSFSLDVLNQYDEDAEHTDIPKEDKDAKFLEALKIASESKTISASFLQRRLKLGYNRAARIVEIMEQEGIVGPPNGSKPRKVIHIPEEYADQLG